jgi:hypothetical protein
VKILSNFSKKRNHVYLSHNNFLNKLSNIQISRIHHQSGNFTHYWVILQLSIHTDLSKVRLLYITKVKSNQTKSSKVGKKSDNEKESNDESMATTTNCHGHKKAQHSIYKKKDNNQRTEHKNNFILRKHMLNDTGNWNPELLLDT